MAKQIYIDSEGNEVLLSGTVNSADILPIEAGSSTMTKAYVDGIKTKSIAITAASGVSVMHQSSGYNDKLCCISAEVRFTSSANTWTTLGTVPIIPTDSVQVEGIDTGDGTTVGIIRLRTNGTIEAYPTKALNNRAVSFSMAFLIT